MIKTGGYILFENHDSGPKGGYNSKFIMRLDFMFEEGVTIIGEVKPKYENTIYEYGKSYEVIVNFLDVDSQAILEYPILASPKIVFKIMQGSKIIGHYETKNVEYIK